MMKAPTLPLLDIECVSGRDLLAKAKCECPKYPESPSLKDIKTELKLWGYNDAYFFDVVNKDERRSSCSTCNKVYVFRWKRDGVEFRFTGETKVPV